jgi:hypothetical protein
MIEQWNYYMQHETNKNEPLPLSKITNKNQPKITHNPDVRVRIKSL